MMKRTSCSTMQVVVSLMVILTLNQRVARCKQADEAERVISVRPFTVDQLPVERVQRDGLLVDEPGLGQCALLDASHHSKSSTEMDTMFDIFTSANQSTIDIKFRANSPELGAAKLDASKSYQFDLEALAKSGFDVGRRTVIMVPGYHSSDESPWQVEARELLLAIHAEDQSGPGVNIIVVGWSDSNKGLYPHAVANTPLVARQIIVFLHYLAQLAGISLRDQNFLDRIHLVGHSLGAHISGFVGQDLGGRVGRITGLDPAGPIFNNASASQRLDRSNAQLVEVLHTNAGHLDVKSTISGFFTKTLATLMRKKPVAKPEASGLYFGTTRQLGHLDYYANDGTSQAGCGCILIGSACSHGRAHSIYLGMLRHELSWRAHKFEPSEVSGRRRLWALHSDSYESYQSGAQLAANCPQLEGDRPLEAVDRCAVPLLDFWTPTLREYTSELRDKFGVNFSKSRIEIEDQPRYYFKSQLPHLVGDSYLLRVHLDPKVTRWYNSKQEVCSLSANLKMENGDELEVVMSTALMSNRSVLSLPFTHPNGPEAQANLRVLLAKIDDAGKPEPESITSSVRSIFPASISMEFTDSQPKCAALSRSKFASTCELAIKAVEVQPVVAMEKCAVSALYEPAGEGELSNDETLKLVDPNELAQRLASDRTSGQLTLKSPSFDTKLVAALIV